ncbi:hypothetical protein Q5P01_019147 [Channa striata]|uniref:Cytokine-like protein 1 n=1 Tax=Channa striata TaxID=64152 RepID=A0AA88M1W0_CHASR|nr:hypothetical protein Q5P01_019147 [Channa striata]
MSIFNHLLLILSLVPLVLSYPFYPPTCYTKVLMMAQDCTQWAADLKSAPETGLCMAHMPKLHLDVHNACVMHKMRDYISLVEGLRNRRCAYTRDVWKLFVTLRQLFVIMSERCHGVLRGLLKGSAVGASEDPPSNEHPDVKSFCLRGSATAAARSA